MGQVLTWRANHAVAFRHGPDRLCCLWFLAIGPREREFGSDLSELGVQLR